MFYKLLHGMERVCMSLGYNVTRAKYIDVLMQVAVFLERGGKEKIRKSLTFLKNHRCITDNLIPVCCFF